MTRPVVPYGANAVDEKISIRLSEYEYLKSRDDELGLLERAGVDNWEWYGEALDPDSTEWD